VPCALLKDEKRKRIDKLRPTLGRKVFAEYVGFESEVVHTNTEAIEDKTRNAD